jgi:hypothetical protein
MSKTVTVQVSDALLDQAEAAATRQQTDVDDVFTGWLAAGMTATALDQLVEPADKRARQQAPLDDHPVDLAVLLPRAPGDLSDAEVVALDEQLRTYRRQLVRKAQSITDWLAQGGLSDADTEVSHLLKVQSAMLYAIGYDNKTEVLEVVFNSGGIYRYFHVPAHVYRELVEAESKGQYMWTNVFNLYPYVRLRRT